MANTFGSLFDLDGTLVDNEHIKALAFSRAIEQFGGKSDPSHYEKVMGLSGPEIRKRLIKDSGLQIDSQAYFAIYKSIYEELLKSKLELRPGIPAFLDDLKTAGLNLAVVSNAYQEIVDWIVETVGIADFFDAVITGDDVINKKPAPDCFITALRTLSLQKDKTVIFEDSEAGILAAHNAGIAAIGIRHTYNQSHDFSTAYKVYSSFENDNILMKNDLNHIFREVIF